LPRLGSLPVTLHRYPRSNGVAADRMASLLMQALELMLQPQSKTKAVAHSREGAVERVRKT
jgi:hypothetical protein